MPFDAEAARARTDQLWDASILPTLLDYVRIPNQSVAFDPLWADHGHMDAAAGLLRDWCAARDLPGTVEIVRLEGRTPVLLCEIQPSSDLVGDDDPVLLYGHFDKQPPMLPWRDGLGPWQPVVEGDRLYGRGAADDGYAVFASLGAIEAVRAAGGTHRRCVVLIEGSEESGSPDLPAYVEHLADRIGTPGLVVCLDSGAGDYDRLWVSTSLRGVVMIELRAEVVEQGIHSGMSAGAPDSFRVLRRVLDRVEDAATGRIVVPELHTDVPDERRRQLEEAASVLGGGPVDELRLVEGVQPLAEGADLLRLRTWEPSLTVIGADGLPELAGAGAVLRPATTLALSFRLPPRVDAQAAAAALVAVLTADPPHGARVTCRVLAAEPGWDAPPSAPWLAAAVEQASTETFGRPPVSIGIGGTIPFMAMLGARFPDAQFLVTGVLGPESNAHGPNEFLHLPTARRLTAAVARVLDAHATR